MGMFGFWLKSPKPETPRLGASAGYASADDGQEYEEEGKRMRYTGRMDEDFEQPDCPLMVDVLADLVAEGNQDKGRAIIGVFRWVYHHNKKWAKALVRRVNGPTGGRDYLASFMDHWGKAVEGKY